MNATDRKITGWLLLKDLPGAKAGTKATYAYGLGAFWGRDVHWDVSVMVNHPDFFLPIHDDNEVCRECNGSGIAVVRYSESFTAGAMCPTCNGQRVVKKQPVKLWQWPPVEKQEIWYLNEDKSIRRFAFYESVMDYSDCFPTLELVEEYAVWRKERGL